MDHLRLPFQAFAVRLLAEAHFRLQPSQTVTFVRQATVRLDLPPPASTGVGYRVE